MDGLRALADSFYGKVLGDEVLGPVFKRFRPEHVERVAVWLAEVFGGPARFTATLGGHRALLEAHLGLSVDEGQRQRWMELMSESIVEVYPNQPRLGDTLRDYFEWGTN